MFDVDQSDDRFDLEITHSLELPFPAKSVSAKLTSLSRAFHFSIETPVVEDHKVLSQLRSRLELMLGSLNPFITQALVRMYQKYLKNGPEYIRDTDTIDAFLRQLAHEYQIKDLRIGANQTIGRIKQIDDELAKVLIERYHFLGYDRIAGNHIGGFSADDGKLTVIATLSDWDLAHANEALEGYGILPPDMIVLARLLILPEKRIILSQFIAQLLRWLRSAMPGKAGLATYCNPNIGHYGTVYRGANMRPLFRETHSAAIFSGDAYQSPRQVQRLASLENDGSQRLDLAFRHLPMPLLVFWHPLTSLKAAGPDTVPNFSLALPSLAARC